MSNRESSREVSRTRVNLRILVRVRYECRVPQKCRSCGCSRAAAAVAITNARRFEEIDRLRAKLELENEYLQTEIKAVFDFGEIVGQSSALKKVLHQIQLVAGTNATVLILGESGTGKELIARAVHERSQRKQRPFIKVNCAAIPDKLFESEFFGHVKGAFTSADKDRVGRVQVADGGTLFLDEIAEIPVGLQAKLLQVLQEQQFERVGETRSRKVDVRIIAATNRDLEKEIEAGCFRNDLFYRLSVFPIEVPPCGNAAKTFLCWLHTFSTFVRRR
jgi:transcriptional regulator with GAF, ATPase, and Fis domain